MYQKYVNHVPLYRQEKDWKNLGMELSRSTLSNWIVKTSDEWLGAMVSRFHEKLLTQTHLHTDAYSGYGVIENIKRCLCWSHARRYFVDAMPKAVKSTEAILPQ